MQSTKSDTKRKAELASFLKAHRARLHPEEFGLPAVGRRRTPGLRRDEVAYLTGVGVSWYTWLEQGRDITVSVQVLERIAQTFRLKPEERNYLFLLAREAIPTVEVSTFDGALPPCIRSVLDALDTHPAFVIDQRFNVLDWSESACAVFGDFDRFRGRERNCIWQLFAHSSSRRLFVDWEDQTRYAISHFRSAYGRCADDPWFDQFIHDLARVSPEFRHLWSEYNVQQDCHHEQELNHTLVGRLRLASNVLVAPGYEALPMIIYTPCSPRTAEKLAILNQNRLQCPLETAASGKVLA